MPQTLTLQRATTLSPLALWHLLSLDAPTVATVWLVFVAHATHTRLPSLLAPAMFLAVWLIYAADRLLDAARPQTGLEPRHHFHHLHRTTFFITMAVAAPALAILLAHTHIPQAYFPLGAAFLAWFAAVHLTSVPAAARLPKELATGLVFSAAIFAPELPHCWPEALALALLCTLNCGWINRWESPRAELRLVPWLTTALLLLAIRPTPVTAAIALAAAALLALNHFRKELHPTTLRAAADLALLTPVLFLPHLK